MELRFMEKTIKYNTWYMVAAIWDVVLLQEILFNQSRIRTEIARRSMGEHGLSAA